LPAFLPTALSKELVQGVLPNSLVQGALVNSLVQGALGNNLVQGALANSFVQGALASSPWSFLRETQAKSQTFARFGAQIAYSCNHCRGFHVVLFL